MSKFIKLTSIIINTMNIATIFLWTPTSSFWICVVILHSVTDTTSIKILPTKYTIFMCNNYIDGVFMFGSGCIDSQ